MNPPLPDPERRFSWYRMTRHPTAHASPRFTARLARLAVVLAGLLVAGCPTDGRRDTFEYLRSPVTFRLDPVAADHPFCQASDKRLGLSEAACRAASKYRLQWERPEDTVGFAEYRIYVDTTPPNSPLSWNSIRKDRTLASFRMEGRPPRFDSLIFVLADSSSPADRERSNPALVALDTTDRLDSTGRLVFAIVTAYRESGLDGQPRYSWAITNDRFAPYPVRPAITAKARSVEIVWERPGDPTSFFDPEADSGIVLAYYLRVVRGGIESIANRDNLPFDPVVTYFAGGVNRTAEVDSTHFKGRKNAPGRLFRLPDSSRVRNRNAADPLDSMRVIINGLSPLDTIDIGLWAVDLAGNVSPIDSSAYERTLMTDTTQPVKPRLRALDSARNGFAYAYTASRDLVPGTGGTLVPANAPNANIEAYRITRVRLAGPTSGVAVFDTLVSVPPNKRNDTLFTDTVRFLAPGATYRLYVRAVDSTGHLSEADSIVVSTLPVRFSGADSAATCPPGFIAVPGGSFLFGDTAAAAAPDERPATSSNLLRAVRPYCIEPREHKEADGSFATRKTWQQAHDACRDMALSMTAADSTWLCTEAEWERACEGTLPDPPLTYGMQSERSGGISVRDACNIGTGDSLMAKTEALRDPLCISYDGAFDMSGNLAEWVLDPYTTSYPTLPDTLERGRPHTPVTATSTRGFRGSHYLNPGQPPAVLLSRARCSNRDMATQARPRPYPGCVDANGPQIVVTYNNVAKPPRCLPLPDTIPPSAVAGLSPARDSSQILILLDRVAQPVVFQMPFDTTYNAAGVKPVDVGLTTRSLAIVTFRNAVTLETVRDTLAAGEILNASQAKLDAVFQREAAPPWSVVKTGGVYDVSFLYAHVQARNAPAKAYYSNAAMGFRCCAKPRP